MLSSRREAGDRQRLGSTAGFTLVEILVALGVMAILAAMVYANVIGRTAGGNAAALLQTIRAVEDGVTAFRNDVRRYPTEIVHLTTQPPSETDDTCDAVIPDRFLAEWVGPYLSRQVDTAGIPVGSSLIENELERIPLNGDTVLAINVAGVDLEIAEVIKRSIDPDLTFTTGTVRWTEDGSTGRGDLSYYMPARGC